MVLVLQLFISFIYQEDHRKIVNKIILIINIFK